MTSSARPHALITGATAGLGREFARQLAAQGHDLTLVARDSARLESVAAALQAAHNVHVTSLAADLSDDRATARVVEYIAAHPVNVLVNNAGFGHAGRIGLVSTTAQDDMVRLHVLAVHRLTQAALPAMLERRSGAVVVVSSTASFLTSAGNVNYCATKAYARIYAEGLALEAGPRGVYVQALCPGFTHTELHERAGIAKRAPAWMWKSAEFVVGKSLGAVRDRRPTVVVPGWLYRFIAFGLRFSPRWLRTLEAQLYRRDR